MRFLFATRPYVGHFFPMVPLARALQRAGHDIVVASAADLQPLVEEAGLSFAQAGRSLAAARFRDGAHIDQYHPDVIGHELSDLLGYARRLPFDVVIREPTDFGGLLAAEALDVVHVTLGRSHFIPASTWLGHLKGSLDTLRAEYGLAPDPSLETAFRHLYLDMVPPWFQPFDVPPIDTLVPIRPEFYDRSIGVLAPAERDVVERWSAGADDGAAPRRVYLTLGTHYNRAQYFFATVTSAAAHLGLEVLCTVGPNQDPDEILHDPVPGVQVLRYVPQSAILGRCSAVICHGGYSTVIGALCEGVPVVIVPYGADHHSNAYQVERLGAGVTVDPRQLTVENVSQALNGVLEDASYRRAAQRLRDATATLADMDHAVGLLERLPAIADRGERAVACSRRLLHQAASARART